MKNLRSQLLLITATAGVAVSPVMAQLAFWDNPAGGNFNTPGNWAGGVVPGAANTAVFGLDSTYTVNFTSNVANQSLQVNAGRVQFISIFNPRTYSLSGAATLGGGSLSIGGVAPQIVLQPSGGVTVGGGSALRIDSNGLLNVPSANGISIGNTTLTSSMTVNGSSAAVTTTGPIRIGHNRPGQMTLLNGATASSSRGEIGVTAGSTGTATIDSGAHWTTSAELMVGVSAPASLVIQGGGSVTTNGFAFVGTDSVAFASSAVVTGSGSRWQINGGAIALSNGTLTIANGAQVNSTGTDFGGLLLTAPGASALLHVTGPGSGLTMAGPLAVGAPAGEAELRITNGAAVSVSQLGVGIGIGTADLPGRVTIEGNGAALNVSGPLIVGGGSFAPNAHGRVTLGFGGELSAAQSITIQPGSSFTVAGGTLSYPSLSAFSVEGELTFGTGTIRLTGSSVLDHVKMSQIFGSAPTIRFAQALEVQGTATLEGGLVLDGGRLRAAQLVNPSLLDLRAGTLHLTAAPLTVGGGGSFGSALTVNSRSSIVLDSTATVAAGAQLHLDGGTFHAGAGMSNSGQIVLGSLSSRLSGGTLVNGGLVSGRGSIGNAVINTSAGEIRSHEPRLVFEKSLHNSGSINLLGGSVEVGDLLTNTAGGRITGRGTIIAEAGLSNSGTMTFTAGFADLFGAVTNHAGSRVTVTGGSGTTFHGPVTNVTGSSFFVALNSRVTFLDAVTGSASFSGPGIKDFEGSGVISAVDSLVGETIVGTGANLTAGVLRERSLTIEGKMTIAPGGTAASTGRVEQLHIAGTPQSWTGRLDLTNNDWIIDYSGASPIDEVRDQLRSGLAGGSWTGSGITSSSAAANAGFALGYAEAAALGVITFSGQVVDGDSLLIRYTRFGDANLDGTVGLADFNRLASNFGTSGGAVWSMGDFNYDGIVNLADFNRLASNFGLAASEPGVTPQDWAALVSAIPEPALPTAQLLAVSLAALRRRRFDLRRCRTGRESHE